jgi:hypothetical protein
MAWWGSQMDRITHLAESTLPKKTSSTSSGLISGTRSTAAVGHVLLAGSLCQGVTTGQFVHLMAWEPNCVALRLERLPRKLPTGVLATETM